MILTQWNAKTKNPKPRNYLNSIYSSLKVKDEVNKGFKCEEEKNCQNKCLLSLSLQIQILIFKWSGTDFPKYV